MKLNEIQTYKNIGTIQMSLDDEGRKVYLYTHGFFNDVGDEDTIKGAREMLDYYERKAQDIRGAINILRGTGYKVFKEIA